MQDSVSIESQSPEYFEAVNRTAIVSMKLTEYFEEKYELSKLQAAILTALYIESIPTQIETNPNAESGLLEVIRGIEEYLN